VLASFEAGRKQYIAVWVWLGCRSRENADRMSLIFPGKYPDVPQGGAIWFFAVK